jgi:GDPmannose 4,6-dehydratase
MLQQDVPEDYVVATGVAHSVKHLLELAFAHVGLDYRDHVEVAQDFLRPADVYHLRGDYSKAHQQLGWEPHISFEQMIEMMVDSDLDLISRTTPKALSSRSG